jgi:hypothetical protein
MNRETVAHVHRLLQCLTVTVRPSLDPELIFMVKSFEKTQFGLKYFVGDNKLGKELKFTHHNRTESCHVISKL